MGFLKETCQVCNSEVGLNRWKIKDGWICPNCFKKSGLKISDLKASTKEDIEKAIREREKINVKAPEEHSNINKLPNREGEELNTKFNITKKIGTYLEIDDENKLWRIPKLTLTGKHKEVPIYHYEDIVDYDLLVDDVGIKGNSKFAGAAAGGILFGASGAILGALGSGKKSEVQSMKIKIVLNDINNPMILIKLFDSGLKKGSWIYNHFTKTAQEILSVLDLIVKQNQQEDKQAKHIDIPEQIKKLAELKEQGILTEDEFETKKKELLRDRKSVV